VDFGEEKMNKKDGMIGMIAGGIFLILPAILLVLNWDNPYNEAFMVISIMGLVLLIVGAIVYDICVGREKDKKESKKET
jgi:membrane protein DedA with SNARE-associated domain